MLNIFLFLLILPLRYIFSLLYNLSSSKNPFPSLPLLLSPPTILSFSWSFLYFLFGLFFQISSNPCFILLKERWNTKKSRVTPLHLPAKNNSCLCHVASLVPIAHLFCSSFSDILLCTLSEFVFWASVYLSHLACQTVCSLRIGPEPGNQCLLKEWMAHILNLTLAWQQRSMWFIYCIFKWIYGGDTD